MNTPALGVVELALRLLICSVLGLAIVAGSATAQEIPEVALQRAEQAERLQQRGDHRAAVRAWREAVELAPSLEQAYLGLGTSLHALGDARAATKAFEDGLQRNPGSANLAYALAAALLSDDAVERSLSVLDEATRRHPDVARLHSLRGGVLRRAGDVSGALAALERARDLDPRDAHINYSLGLTHHQLGDIDRAIEAFRRAVALRADFPQARFNLGALLFENGALDEALEVYQGVLADIADQMDRGVEVNPVFAQAFSNLGAIYLGRGEQEKALDAYRRAVSLSPTLAQAHYNIGYLELQLGRDQEAFAAYERALELTDDLPLAYLHMGQVKARLGDHETAVEILTRGLGTLSGDSLHEAYRQLAASLAAIGDVNAQRDVYESILARRPNDAEAALGLARLLRRQGQEEEAERILQRSLAQSATEAVALEMASMAESSAGEAARRRYLVALKGREEAPQWWPTQANLGQLLMAGADLVGAEVWLARALRGARRLGESQIAGELAVRYAMSLAGQGRFEEALDAVAGVEGVEAATLRTYLSALLAPALAPALAVDTGSDERPDGAVFPVQDAMLQVFAGAGENQVATLRTAARRWSRWAGLHWLLAVALARNGEPDQALASLNAALDGCKAGGAPPVSTFPMAVRLRANRSGCEAIRQDLEAMLVATIGAALAQGDKALLEDVSRLLDSLDVSPITQGRLLAAQGLAQLRDANYAAAVGYLTLALEESQLDPVTQAETRFNLVVSLYRMGRHAEAWERLAPLIESGSPEPPVALLAALLLDAPDRDPAAARIWYDRYASAAQHPDPVARARLEALRKVFP